MRVFVVEDEALILLSTQFILETLAFEVVGTAMRLDEALAKSASVDCDVPLLDVNLGRDRSFPVADLLASRGVPFVFATGYGRASIPVEYQGRPVVNKPYLAAELGTALASAIGSS